jgi:serine/threonine-protein kinase
MSEATPEDITPPEAELDAGMRIGEYEIEAKIGQGGFGTVYRAVHPVIGKVVAIKVLARKFSADPEMVSRFIAEARSVNQIRHRHIIDIFLFGKLDDGRNYYVMEYLDGEPLDARIDRDKRIALSDALPILRGIARALDAAHAKGVTHRDLKPENVFLVRDADSGEVWPKLLDFGIAKLMGSDDPQKHKTRTGIPIGTPFYMSPEQCRGKDVDHRTDYYAFGVVAYQLLTGEVPLDAEDYMTIMMRQLADEPAPPSTIVPEIPSGVDDAIAWLMKKNRDDRPSTLGAAMRAMEQAAEEAGIAVPKSTLAYDAVTPPSGLRVATPTPRSPTAPKAPGLAATMPSGAGTELPARRSVVPWIVGGVVVVAIAVVAIVMVVMKNGDQKPVTINVPVAAPQPAPPPAPVTAPAPAPQPAPATAPVAAPGTGSGSGSGSGSISTAAGAPTPTHRPTKKKAPNKDDIIDVFGKDKQ